MKQNRRIKNVGREKIYIRRKEESVCIVGKKWKDVENEEEHKGMYIMHPAMRGTGRDTNSSL